MHTIDIVFCSQFYLRKNSRAGEEVPDVSPWTSDSTSSCLTLYKKTIYVLGVMILQQNMYEAMEASYE